MDHLLHRTTNESTYYAPPPRKSLLHTTTNCNYRKPQDPSKTWAHLICGVNWNQLRICVRSRNSPPHHIRVVTVHWSTGFAKWQSPPWKPRAYSSVSEFFWIQVYRKGTHKSMGPNKAKCCKFFQKDGKTRPSCSWDLSFLQIFQRERPMKNDEMAN